MRTRYPLTVTVLLLVAFCFRGGLGASSASGQTSYIIYAPVVIQLNSSQPKLIYPTNGAVLNTLIPDFQWNNGVQPSNTKGCLGLSTIPHPPACHLYFTMVSNTTRDWLSWDNLQPNTIYYWRVGAVYNEDYNHPVWSEEWYFRSGPAGGTILPAPNLVQPADNVVLDVPNLIFSWTPVSGALQYTFFLASSTSTTTYLFFTTTPQIDFRERTGNFKPNTPYQWYVNARNNYAWSPDSAVRNFTVNIPQSPGLSPDDLRLPFFYQHLDGGRTRIELQK